MCKEITRGLAEPMTQADTSRLMAVVKGDKQSRLVTALSEATTQASANAEEDPRSSANLEALQLMAAQSGLRLNVRS